MKSLYSCLVTLRIIARYFVYRLGIGERPNFTDRWDEVQRFYRQITGMDSRIRLRGLEHYPGGHPAVYAGNHVKLDDPFFVCYAVQEASHYTQRIRFVMRDDFFVGFPWNVMPFRMNEVAEMGGAYNISKDGISLAQLKPLIDMLLEPDSFVIFPNGSRSRSGLIFEYREDREGPGSMAFFLAQAQRKNPEVRVPAVPVGRTHNPVTGISTVILGEPMYLPEGARREVQRQFDDELVLSISNLVEINGVHLTAGILYLHALHQLEFEITSVHLTKLVEEIVAHLSERRYLDPALCSLTQKTMNATISYFARGGMVTQRGETIVLERTAILAAPAIDTAYRTKNPVKFSVNQIMHLPDVVAALEESVLVGA